MSDPRLILGLSGSLRRGSYNTALLRASGELVPAGMRVEIFDLAHIPMFNDDVLHAALPDEVVRLRDAIQSAGALLIATPEYNRSVPAVLKNAIDWISRVPGHVFKNKPLAIMGASNGHLGAAFANYHLRQIFIYLDAAMVNGPEVMVSDAQTKFDESGRLVHESTRRFVAGHLERLRDLYMRQYEGEAPLLR